MRPPVVLQPDPARTIEGLRDTGYDFNTAMADIIDNSIAAEASLVNIYIELDFEGNVIVLVADNGYGMDEADLLNAMQYGSKKRPDPHSLGKFGLGLKTASTAFCRCLSVISRPDATSPVLKAQWDLDHVATVGIWELLLPDPSEDEIRILNENAPNHSGTIVLWKKIDRLLKAYQDPAGVHARNALNKSINELKEHVAMVYQRFIDKNNPRANSLDIIVNGEVIKPWDPFCKDEPNTEIAAQDKIAVEIGEDGDAFFEVAAYILPRREDFANKEIAKNARITTDRQGIYIYRENRLIHHGGWLGMFVKDPHDSLLRVEFSFDSKLDDAFHVDIKKSRIILDNELYNWLKDQFLPAPRRASDQRYRKGINKQVSTISKGAHSSSNSSIAARENDLHMANVEVTDQANNEVEITNKKGKVRIKLAIQEPVHEGEVIIQPADSIDNGLLWEPCLINMHHGVRINTGHPYYHKVYVPNLASGVIVQGMDSLLWAICEAELGTINEATKKHFQELRFEVSKLLRTLVEDLPDPEVGNE